VLLFYNIIVIIEIASYRELFAIMYMQNFFSLLIGFALLTDINVADVLLML